jgi:DNA-binding transcriptional MerR regulator/ubiquinone/menaquinone biosynthesis C-methylase UbiE
MYRISDMCEKLSLARSTLLYYERIGLVRPSRDPGNGYRLFSEQDFNQLILVRQLQKAGLSLQECKSFLAGQVDAELLEHRLFKLEQELREMETAREVLSALYGKVTGRSIESGPFSQRLNEWHIKFDKQSSAAHIQWLQQLGFSEKEALHIRCVSRDMATNQEYMEQFFSVYELMERPGPGSKDATLRAFKSIQHKVDINKILDIGCGKGSASLVLAEVCDAQITAVDNHAPFLQSLQQKAEKLGLSDRITPVNASMLELPYSDQSFDLLWAEGTAYIMGVEKALREWKRLIPAGGYLFFSDLVLTTDQPSPECVEFWKTGYPDMTTPENRQQLAEQLGYRVVDSFFLPREDWSAFYADMQRQLEAVSKHSGPSKVFSDMQKEIRIGQLYGDEFSYVCLLLQKL